jgi:uncharacterized protein YndB with AHSA1/START domain
MKPSLLIAVLLWPCGLAVAAVKQSSPSAMTIEVDEQAKVEAGDLYRAIARVDHWWSSQHTFSGSAGNLSLEPRAGGCFCERWNDGSVEHGRVIQTQRDRLLRLQSTLGPLMEMGLSGVLTFALAPQGKGTTALEVTYRVSGDPSHELAKLAPVVDRVLGEQVRRLVKFAETGKTE